MDKNEVFENVMDHRNGVELILLQNWLTFYCNHLVFSVVPMIVVMKRNNHKWIGIPLTLVRELLGSLGNYWFSFVKKYLPSSTSKTMERNWDDCHDMSEKYH